MDQKLATKIYNVMCAIEGVEKGVTVGEGTRGEYKAVGEADVLNVIKPLLKQEKLICIPVEGEMQESVSSYVDGYNKNKLRAITQLKVYFNVIDTETGESVQIVGFGNGADSQDKGSGKAFTYAYKTALQKTFCMFSGEDTDNTHSNEYEKSEETVTTKQLSEAIEATGNSDDVYIDWYNEKYNKNITDIKYISQEIKQKLYKKLKEN